jgi:uncharacterized damage-inducible protein DinB
MNADAFRELFDYHFTINHKIWTQCILPLTQEQFLQEIPYSVGSVRNQIVHMMDIEDVWFRDLQGEPFNGHADADQYNDRPHLRANWDRIETEIKTYLEALHDQDLMRSIDIDNGSGGILTFQVWQGLIHVINHATDHRAQLLSLLNGLGCETMPQDFASYFFKTL